MIGYFVTIIFDNSLVELFTKEPASNFQLAVQSHFYLAALQNKIFVHNVALSPA